MDIDIAPYIKELLYKHNNLVIPGFGNFVLSYASTTIDHVQGMLNPPSKKIAFDTNLITNDGKLIDHIKEKHQLGTEDATAIINTFVSKIKMQLGKREMVTLPEVGRLYKDFEDNIQFIPDVTNFNKESFGLPTINFYPILRENTSKTNIPTATKANVPTTSTKPSPKKNVLNKNVLNKSTNTAIKKATTAKNTMKKPIKKGFWDTYYWIPGALLVLLLAGLGTCVIYPKIKGTATVVDNRVNQKPSKIDEDALEDPKEDMIDMQIEQEAEKEVDNIDTESITVNPNQRECIVSIGVFGERANATKMIQEVYDKGYDAYRENYIKDGRDLTKVGVQFAYETQEEYQRKVDLIKQDFPNAVVIKK